MVKPILANRLSVCMKILLQCVLITITFYRFEQTSFSVDAVSTNHGHFNTAISQRSRHSSSTSFRAKGKKENHPRNDIPLSANTFNLIKNSNCGRNEKDIKAVAEVSKQKRRKKVKNVKNNDLLLVDDPFDPNYQQQLTVRELREQLGLIGRTVANSVDVVTTTVTAYASGGLMGYVCGGCLGVRTLFKSTQINGVNPSTGVVSGVQELRMRMGNMNGVAVSNAKNWARFSAAFSGFNALARVCRNGKEDKWNGIAGSFCAGAFLNRSGGAQMMMTNGLQYAGFSYIFEELVGKTKKQ